MTPLITEMVKYAPEPESAMWFDLGQLTRMDAYRVPVELLFNLPFKKTAIAAMDHAGIKFALWLLEGDRSLTIAGVTMENGLKYIRPVAVIAREDKIHYYSGGQEIPESEAKSLIRVTIACLLKIQSTNTVYQPHIQQTLVNAKRKRKGKQPLISWHTVKIESPTEKREHQGGTHASPRLHDRRGHWRTYKSGKRGWVKSCKVGGATNGMVFKDYEVAQAPPPQSSQ